MSDLKKIVSEQHYRRSQQVGWPDYLEFVSGATVDNTEVAQQISEFVQRCQDSYQRLIEKGLEATAGNQAGQRQVFFDKRFQGDTHCTVPWETMSVGSEGTVTICMSPAWIPVSVGNVLTADDIYTDILNSPSAQSIRNEILQGRYYYCNNTLCRFFDHYDKKLYQQTPEDIADIADFDALAPVTRNDTCVTQIPRNIIFDFDPTCNLRCPSCRFNVINYNKHPEFRANNDNIAEKIKHLIIDNIGTQPIEIRWAGGEPFISEVYLDLMDYIIATGRRNIRHVIQTNGSYLKKKQELVTKLLPFINELRISFDAATAETYSRVRVNGQWDLLLENVRWVQDQIKQQGLKVRVKADFVVQLDNYQEIPQFRTLCNELGIKQINFQRMWNWNTWPIEELDRRNVYNANHPLYPEVMRLLDSIGDSEGSILIKDLGLKKDLT
jgi:sulfatase maturation enzyme AslB (radical SAM superfamily)